MLDFAIIVGLLLSVLWGYLRGALHDVLGLAALAVAYVASAPFGRSLGQVLVHHWGISSVAAYVIARVGAGLLIYVSLKVSATVADRLFGQDETGVTRPWNRNLGALMGLASGAVLALIVLFLSDSLYKAFPDSQNGFVRAAAASRFRRLVSGHNPADRFLLTDLLSLLRVAQEDPEVLNQLAQDERVKKLMDDPTLKAVLEDKDLIDAVHNEEFDKIFANQHLRKLLEDRSLMLQVVSPDVPPDLGSVIRELLRKRKQEQGEEQQTGK